MELKDAIKEVNSKALMYLKPAGDGKSYVCPICNSGANGKHNNGITTTDDIHFTCWTGCYTNASYIDILALKEGIAPTITEDGKQKANIEAIKHACDITGVILDAPKQTKSRPKTDQNKEAVNFDYEKFFNECHSKVNNKNCLEYLNKRHLTEKTINRFNLGYCDDFRPRTKDGQIVSKAPATQRLIIPFKTGYLARDINSNGDYSKQKQGKMGFLNIEALDQSDRPIFIVEGEIDALSIIEAGEEAISLGSLSMLDNFITYAMIHKPKHPLIIALDNDKAEGKDAGEKATAKLKERQDELRQAGISLIFPDVDALFCGKKDANEALVEADFFDFAPALANAVIEAMAMEEAEAEARQETINKDSAFNALDELDSYIENSKEASYISTGFTELDNILDGGLFNGLYIVGAISSLGKTTFCLQIADQLAMQGIDVLIFSLEMSKIELMAKSISRLTSIIDLVQTKSNYNAKTTRGILTGSKYKNYSETELNLIKQAKKEYAKYAKHIYIHEGMGNISINYIKKVVEQFKAVKGKAPVILIDYLQIIAPDKDQKFLTDKQNTDINVMELKRISRDYKTTVIGISSFNRENYTAPVNMASFKESGAIEYSSDVLIGLQYKAMNELKEDGKDKAKASVIMGEIAEKAKNKEAIEIQVKILKNRNGNKGSIDLDFYPMFNKFKDSKPNVF